MVDLLFYLTGLYRFFRILKAEQIQFMIMEQELTPGVKMLNGFLKLMIVCLIGILIAIPLAGLADWLGLI